MLVGVLSGTPNTRQSPSSIRRNCRLLKASYVNLQKAITKLSDQLQAPVFVFRNMTKLGALILILEDQHESIWGSRSRTRAATTWVPPWSK